MPVAGCGRCGRTLPTGPVCPTSLGPTNTAETITETLNRAEAGQLGYLDFLDQILAEEISVKDSRRFRYPLLGIGQEPPGGVIGEIRPSRRGNREPCRARTLNFPARPMEPLYVTPGKRGSRKAPTGPCWPHDRPISPILRFATQSCVFSAYSGILRRAVRQFAAIRTQSLEGTDSHEFTKNCRQPQNSCRTAWPDKRVIFMSPVTGIAQDEPVATTFDPADQSDIEVLVGESWRAGQLRNWVERGGEQCASVEYAVGSSTHHIAVVPLLRLRKPALAV